MIVMDSHQVIRLITLHHGFTEDAIRLDVCLPAFRGELQLRKKVVKHRPQSLVGVAFVESCSPPNPEEPPCALPGPPPRSRPPNQSSPHRFFAAGGSSRWPGRQNFVLSPSGHRPSAESAGGGSKQQ